MKRSESTSKWPNRLAPSENRRLIVRSPGRPFPVLRRRRFEKRLQSPTRGGTHCLSMHPLRTLLLLATLMELLYKGIPMADALWRDVINFLGNAYPTPDRLLPLLEFVADRHADVGGFLRWIPKVLSDPRDRAELDEELRNVGIGYAIWRDQREALHRWANASERGPFTPEQVDEWWFAERGPNELRVDELGRLDEFLAAVHLNPEDARYIQEELRDDHLDDLVIHRLRHDLHWLDDLNLLRDLARKTWPADPADRQLWVEWELDFVSEYYADQQPILEGGETPSGGIDPFALRPVSYEQSLGFGLDGLGYCMTVLLRATIIDFVDEILEHSRFPRVRGSLRCVECGFFVGRRALGYGQLYCAARCKKRAAKRRYRVRCTNGNWHDRSPSLTPRPQHETVSIRR